MDWRNKIIVNSVLKDIVSKVGENLEVSELLNQTGSGGDIPENAVFEWHLLKDAQGNEISTKYSSRFRRQERRARFNIKHNFGAFSDLFDVERNIDNMFHQFMVKQLENVGENDLISINIIHEELERSLGNIFIPPFRKKDFNLFNQSFFNAIYEVSQSNTTFLLNGLMTLDLNITQALNGSGSEKDKKRIRVKPPQTKDEKIKASRSIIGIKNEDNGCAFHALAVCIKRYQIPKQNLYDFECIRRNTNKVRENFAFYLANLCGFNLSKSVYITDFKLIQEKIPDYQIIIIDEKNY